MKELKASAQWYKEHGWTFEDWYDYGHAYGAKKRIAKQVWESVGKEGK